MRRLLKIIFSILIFTSPILGEADYFMVTDIGSSARSIRVGNVEGFGEYANTVFENPAAPYYTEGYTASVFTTKIMDEVTYQNIALSGKFLGGTVAVGYMMAGVQEIPKTIELNFGNTNPDFDDTEFGVEGYFEYINSITKISYAVSQTEYLHFGMSANYYQTSLDTYSGSGFNFDIGTIIEAYPFTFSIAARNIVSSLKVNYSHNQTEKLPLQTVYGAAYYWDDFIFYGQVKTVGGNKKFLKAAAVAYRPSMFEMIELSAGYKEVPVIRDVKNNFTFGLGLDIMDISVDYAYEQSEHVEFNHKHYFSLAISY
jgi:hypothetical protein